MDFILKTYVPHQRLYQAFLNGDTGLKHIRSELEIEGPPLPPPLCEGTDALELEQQLILKETKSKKAAEIMKLKEKTEAEMMAKLQASLNDLPMEGNMSIQVNDSQHLQYELFSFFVVLGGWEIIYNPTLNAHPII